jgi:hypothetical protein
LGVVGKELEVGDWECGVVASWAVRVGSWDLVAGNWDWETG